jgi:hypothetical protein
MRSYEAMHAPPLDWFKASFCQNGECVEIAAYSGTVIMRNSAQPDSTYAYFTTEAFGSFLKRAKAGEFGSPSSCK